MTNLQCFSLALNHITPCVQLEKRRTDEKAERDRLNDIYLELIEKQRAYYKTVRDFQEVGCFTNITQLSFSLCHSFMCCITSYQSGPGVHQSKSNLYEWLELLKEDNECNLVSLLQDQVLCFY